MGITAGYLCYNLTSSVWWFDVICALMLLIIYLVKANELKNKITPSGV
jgi:hypothetical protein